ncbi:hypothetical protein EJ05DRAFT_319239 [Pseudovirgaria hyperparasitica]|uniref:AD domain-containing protein n=1 Tax=Pseudovirgaria hyperparasitica TaxID=470096 RepID=A0A6A6WAZ1_9PEZI|nr:uncharacterized protein EJ05DRAFT_319239 [Pseudovirgaria hyperparasitica]KAF2760022.1 hypothetical protein EJ05DRAFT_319239 [Pseudovirgaria hyperparasitica]
MAENKRNSVSGKLASPKPGGAQKDLADMGDVLYKAVGARVKVSVAPHNTAYEGTIFAVSPETNLLAINTAPPPPNPSTSAFSQPGNFHVIPICHLLSFTVLSPAERTEGAVDGFAGVQPPIDKLDTAALSQREEAAVRKLKEKEATKNRAVSKEGQDIFDSIARTLPCRWHEASIIVNDAVMIKPPYRVEDCQAPKDKDRSLAQVKKILEGFLARKGRSATTNNVRPAVATAIPLRKGG